MQKQGSLRAFLYKACLRCRGDFVLDAEEKPRLVEDQRREYVCLQCGRRAAVETASVVRVPAAASRAA